MGTGLEKFLKTCDLDLENLLAIFLALESMMCSKENGFSCMFPDFINNDFTSFGKVSWFYLAVGKFLSYKQLHLINSPQNFINHLMILFDPKLGNIRGKVNFAFIWLSKSRTVFFKSFLKE